MYFLTYPQQPQSYSPMIKYEKFTLENGLQVIVHEDPTSLVAVVNIMYNVGARDDNPYKTGFAHLFEHLMFGGSENIASYDEELQRVGGSNNAYTSHDVTSYHCTLPVVNLETAFWLESDRMLGLAFNKKSLEVQKKVVIEEFKEVYLNQPYGDAWLHLTQLAYTKHPYQFPIIGKEIDHIEQMTMQEVKAFFQKFYVPNNAVLVVAGGVETDQVKKLSQKWFGPIAPGKVSAKNFPQEPTQQAQHQSTITKPVPLEALYRAYHVPGRLEQTYYAVELLCTIVGIGKSSRLYQGLVEAETHFSKIGSYTTQTIDPGLLVITGRVNEGVSLETAAKSLQAIIESIRTQGFTSTELEKAKNHLEAELAYAHVDIAQRAEELAFATLLGDTNLVNTYIDSLASVTLEELNAVSQQVLQEENSSTLYYRKK
jgi:zinc protease